MNGIAGATSCWGTKVAQDGFNWKSWMSGGGFPVYIWMRFTTPQKITAIGFGSGWSVEAPKRFAVVGSSNCAEPWTSLLHVDDSGFVYDNEFHSWIVPEKNRRSFHCIGI